MPLTYKYNKKFIKANWVNRLTLFSLLIASNSHIAHAGDFSIDAGLDLEYVSQDIDLKDSDEKVDASSQILRPYTTLSYLSKDSQLQLKIEHNHLNRDLDDESLNQDYTTYNLNGSHDIIRNLLRLQIFGVQTYRSDGFNSFIADDFLLNGDNLIKVKTNGASLNLNIAQGQIFGLTGSLNYQTLKANQDRTNRPLTDLVEGDTIALSFTAINGKSITNNDTSLSGNYSIRERTSGEDFIIKSLNFSNAYFVNDSLGIVLNATYEDNEVETLEGATFDGLREFTSYGAGLRWQSSPQRSIELAYNTSTTKSLVNPENDGDNNFVSYAVNWAFSERTSLQGSLSRRFFGRSGNLSFQHQLRNWRTSLTYNENVTTNSQFVPSDSLGLFICDNGSTSLDDCTLSDTLNPVLDVGQTALPFVFRDVLLNDRIVLRKQLSFTSALSLRRTTVLINAAKSKNSEQEIPGSFDSLNYGISALYNISHKTNLDIGVRYNEIEGSTTGEPQTEKNTEYSIKMTRDFSRRITGQIGFRYLERKGQVVRQSQDFRGLSGPLTDNRITIGISISY